MLSFHSQFPTEERNQKTLREKKVTSIHYWRNSRNREIDILTCKNFIQLGSEYRTPKFQKHLNSWLFRIQFMNGPTIWIPVWFLNGCYKHPKMCWVFRWLLMPFKKLDPFLCHFWRGRWNRVHVPAVRSRYLTYRPARTTFIELYIW